MEVSPPQKRWNDMAEVTHPQTAMFTHSLCSFSIFESMILSDLAVRSGSSLGHPTSDASDAASALVAKSSRVAEQAPNDARGPHVRRCSLPSVCY